MKYVKSAKNSIFHFLYITLGFERKNNCLLVLTQFKVNTGFQIMFK